MTDVSPSADLSADPCRWTATEQLAQLRAKKISSRELLELHEQRIDAVNPIVNAIVTRTPELAHEAATAADEAWAKGEWLGPLHGLPVAIKDLQMTKGVRTTFGSLVHEHNVPDEDAILVERMLGAGSVMVGKTNTPEFATGSHTYNKVFGTTLNPYDTTKSAGGSSGGATVSLNTGMAALADGSDMGGSLRNPAAYGNVFGLRPTYGRVPQYPVRDSWFTLSLEGPMGRTAQDTALLLSVIAGEDVRQATSLPGDGSEFAVDLTRDMKELRVGWSDDLNGLEIEQVITDVLNANARPAFAEIGATIKDVRPDMTDADFVFRTERGWYYAASYAHLLADHRDQLNDSVVANVEAGLKVTGDDLARAANARTALYYRMVELFKDIDVLVAPVTSVPPFPADEPWVKYINGKEQPDYLAWMSVVCQITATGFVAASVPMGFTPDGLPVGLQIIVPSRQELLALQIGHALEQVRPYWRQAPPVLANLS